MFLRTFLFNLDENTNITLRELSFQDYFDFSAKGSKMVNDQATADEWIHRQLELIARCIVDPAVSPGGDGITPPNWTAEEVGKQFGKRIADRMYREILEFSGLDQPKDRPQVGEDRATGDPSLKKSAVA